jgi:hypothetical protein
MSDHPRGRPHSPSPRVPDSALARHADATRAPAPHTAAELERLLRMLRESGAHGIAIGHGRHPASVAAAGALATAWSAGPGAVLAVVDWPGTAASWLRPARRLASCHPDAWVVADTAAGCAQVGRRLAEQPGWSPGRTFGFAALATAGLVTLSGPGTLTGMTGASANGGWWRVDRGLLITTDDTGGAAR